MAEKLFLFFNISITLTERYTYGNDCMIMADQFIVVYTDGHRSYAELKTADDTIYHFPCYLTKGGTITGYVVFPFDQAYKNFMLYITDSINNNDIGKGRYIDFCLK